MDKQSVLCYNETTLNKEPYMAFKKKKTEALDAVEQRNKENGEVVGGEHVVDFNGPITRKKNETTQEYNERVPIAYQPALETPKTSYLGQPL